ncbi:hypothetical protein [Methylobacterium sp. Leaf125]|uniref:hypothetical protein n=1 Tax=Methylobacterium sp. Leaf125 TaxID=1736265 RepID=UPI000A470529|nr:hypothetical protein [Methylobacterium sp. Leaf125]
MSVTIDPSETRRPAPPAPRPSRANLRLVLLSGAGLLGLAGFTAFAFATLGSLAGPQFARPTLATASATPASLGRNASEWPDLRDGVPVLAPAQPKPVAAVPDQPAAAPKAALLPAAIAPPTAPVAEVKPSQAKPADAKPVDATSLQAKSLEPKSWESKPAGVTLAEARPPEQRVSEALPVEKPTAAPVATKPARLPPIENAAVLPPARPASLVPATRTAALIAPLPNETTRSRATNGTFTALAPEGPKHNPVAKTPETRASVDKPVVVKPVATKPVVAKAASAKPAKPETAPAPQVAQAEPEPEQTEFLGVKVPSLAPAGRKIAESVEALGNAVRNLPDHF